MIDTRMARRFARRVAALCAPLVAALALQAQAAPNEGGSTQVSAQPGCLNQWMFNGMWRVRATKVTFRPAADGYSNAWDVTMQWGNGTAFADLSPNDTLVGDLVIALGNGDTLSANSTTYGTLIQQKLDYRTFPASGQYTFTQTFYSSDTLDEANKPAKLLVTFDVPKYRSYNPTGGKYWNQKTKGYNYRIDLNCNRAS